AAAAGDDDARAVAVEVGDQLARVRIAHHRAGWDARDHVGAAVAVLLLAAAVLAALGVQQRLVLEVEQGGEGVVDLEHGVAAGSAVAAVGSALWAVLLAQKTAAAGP